MAEVIWVRFSAGGAATAVVAALPVVLPSGAEGLLSAVGVFTSFDVVAESGALVIPFAFISPGVLLSAVGFEVVAGAIVSVVFALPSALTSPECFASGAPCACCGVAAAGEPCGAAVGASFAVGAFIGAAVSAFGETAAGDSAPLAPP
ncbi:hypothetical protein ACVWZK_005914 [Bradyrhizobium sp. GM0.4]